MYKVHNMIHVHCAKVTFLVTESKRLLTAAFLWDENVESYELTLACTL